MNITNITNHSETKTLLCSACKKELDTSKLPPVPKFTLELPEVISVDDAFFLQYIWHTSFAGTIVCPDCGCSHEVLHSYNKEESRLEAYPQGEEFDMLPLDSDLFEEPCPHCGENLQIALSSAYETEYEGNGNFTGQGEVDCEHCGELVEFTFTVDDNFSYGISL